VELGVLRDLVQHAFALRDRALARLIRVLLGGVHASSYHERPSRAREEGMVMRTECASILLLLAACGSEDETPFVPTDGLARGARVRAKVLQKPWGARVFPGFSALA